MPVLKYWTGSAWSALAGQGSVIYDGFRRRYSGSNYSLPAGVATAIVYDLVVDAQGTSIFTWDGTNKWIVIPSDGVYYIHANAQGENNAWPATQVYQEIRVNGVGVSLQYPSGSLYDSIENDIVITLKANDKVQIIQYSTVNTTARVTTGTAGSPMAPTLSIWRIGTGPPGPQGPVGLTGPDIAAAQSSYFHAQLSGPAGAMGNGSFTTIAWGAPILSNGITWSAGQAGNIFSTNTGRYHVSAQICATVGASASAWLIGAINHYNASSVLKSTRQVVGTGSGASWYSEVVVEGIFDVVAGDFFQVAVQPNNTTSALDNRSYVEIIPVGGVKGDKGDTGPDITAAQSSYFYGQAVQATNQPAGTNNVVSWAAVYNNGFTGIPGTNITITNAGRYLVHFTATVLTSAGMVNTGTTVRLLDSVNTVKVSRDTIGGADLNGGTWADIVATHIFDCAAGDKIQCFTSVATGTYTLDGRTWVSIVPVGGVKGDKGDTGSSGGPVPIGGTTNQIIVKQSATDMNVAWANPIGRCIARRNGTIGGALLNAYAGAKTPVHYVTAIMETGRLYLIQFTFRAIQRDRGMYSILEKDSVAYAAFDNYISAATIINGNNWTSANICWLVPGTGNEGSHQWRQMAVAAVTGFQSQIYNNDGGYAAVFDMGPDPGNQ